MRPFTLYNLYPKPLQIIQDPCYSGYVYEDNNFQGTYFGVSYTPTNKILFVYKQFNTDILFQSTLAPQKDFITPNSTTLQFNTSLNLTFIGIKVDNIDNPTLILS